MKYADVKDDDLKDKGLTIDTRLLLRVLHAICGELDSISYALREANKKGKRGK